MTSFLETPHKLSSTAARVSRCHYNLCVHIRESREVPVKTNLEITDEGNFEAPSRGIAWRTSQRGPADAPNSGSLVCWVKHLFRAAVGLCLSADSESLVVVATTVAEDENTGLRSTIVRVRTDPTVTPSASSPVPRSGRQALRPQPKGLGRCAGSIGTVASCCI